MARKGGAQEINAGSMADIAFLLLIFFLVTTTMDVDRGITRKLPPYIPPEEKEKIDVNERNVFVVLVNSADQILAGKKKDSKKRMDISQLRPAAKDFLRVHPNNPNYPETETKTIEGLGEITVSKGVISMQNDRGTSYKMYIQVQDALTAAVRELRDEMAMKHFGKKFGELEDEKAVKAIQDAIPVSISEAEPKNVGG